MTSIVILQSSYIPWKGYFDLIHDADVFIFYDDVKFTKNDWRNRNRIKTTQGSQWLSVPVGNKISRKICEVELCSSNWQAKHFASLRQNYCKCPFFEQYSFLLDELLLNKRWKFLSQVNQYAIQLIADLLGIKTEFIDSRSLASRGVKVDRLLSLIKQTGADTYISGPSAKAYIDEERFKREGIQLVWKDYSGYPEYPQRFPPFDHAVTILDLLFNVGPKAAYYIWGWRE